MTGTYCEILKIKYLLDATYLTQKVLFLNHFAHSETCDNFKIRSEISSSRIAEEEMV